MYTGISIDVTRDNGYDNVLVKDNVKLITPGLNRVLGNPYQVEVKRYIPYEQ